MQRVTKKFWQRGVYSQESKPEFLKRNLKCKFQQNHCGNVYIESNYTNIKQGAYSQKSIVNNIYYVLGIV